MKINLGGAFTLTMGIGLYDLSRKFFETKPDISSWGSGEWVVFSVTILGSWLLCAIALTPPDYDELQKLLKKEEK